MKTITPNVLEIIADMHDFVGENWDAFKSYMEEKGFTDDDVESMGDKLQEYLEEENIR